MRPFYKMEENNPLENLNKTPSKMARLAWPKAKYGVIIAVIIIITFPQLALWLPEQMIQPLK